MKNDMRKEIYIFSFIYIYIYISPQKPGGLLGRDRESGGRDSWGGGGGGRNK